ncbi:MAG: AMP-binding protein [Gammaproteobacteria bacterium]|nr:AMP-binding protein [Gammaproteobacteria bacterium]
MDNFYALCAQRMGTGPFIQDANGVELYSYSDLEKLSARIANQFDALGIKKGDRLAIQVEKSVHNLLIYFACLRAGIIYLPLNTAYQAQELSYFIKDASPSVIVCDPSREETFQIINNQNGDNAKTAILTLDREGIGSVTQHLDNYSSERNVVECSPNDTAVILYTSGTTGKPKGAMITHNNLKTNALTLLETWRWQKEDIMLHALPVFHIHGLFVATHLPVLNASPVVFLEKFDPAKVIDCFQRSTVYMGVPTNYTRLLDSGNLNRQACKNMRLFTCGSAPLLEKTFEEFRQITGHTIVERYGMTETGMNSSNPVSGIRKAGTVGLPLESVEIRLVDEAGSRVQTGSPGHLQVRGPNVFSGYWQMPDKTSDEFTSDGFFKTGDIASMDTDGYLSIVGRNKDMIITGGLNVYPKEIELLLDELDNVIESAVIGVPHPDFGEAVVAVVATQDREMSEEKIKGLLGQRLAGYKVPKAVVFVEELPKNTMGKVQKNVLRERFSALL